MRILQIGQAVFLAGIMAGVSPAGAQDCGNPANQAEMNNCAYGDWQLADAELNRVWKQAMKVARQMDLDYLPDGQRPAVDILRDAQRLWIKFRDQACEAESLAFRGGSAQAMLLYACMERLTVRRTEDLKQFAQTY